MLQGFSTGYNFCYNKKVVYKLSLVKNLIMLKKLVESKNLKRYRRYRRSIFEKHGYTIITIAAALFVGLLLIIQKSI